MEMHTTFQSQIGRWFYKCLIANKLVERDFTKSKCQSYRKCQKCPPDDRIRTRSTRLTMRRALHDGVAPRLSVQRQSNSRGWLHCAFPCKRHQMRHLCDLSCLLAKQVLSQLSYTPTTTI